MSVTKTNRSHLTAVAQALFVTFLWSTSWVLIKFGLRSDLPPVTFAGLRYTLAFLCLLPVVLFNTEHRKTIRELPKAQWGELIVLGLLYYTLAQGSQFVGLALLPAPTLTLLLNFSPIFIAVYSMYSIHERTSLLQWGGIFITVVGALVYFLPLSLEGGQTLGLLAAFVGVTSNAAAAVLGRKVNSHGRISPIVVTTISMGVGGVLMLGIGVGVQGIRVLTLQQWAIIGWLALVNTAFAFTLWNKSLQTLTAVESGIINSTMLPQITILAWIFLGETINGKQMLGLAFVVAGILIVQLWRYLPISKNKL
ncbi:MAG: DMT family transporter [Anaerolineales bacterium]|nr:DMT family transporter [Anaerolineales bacterium]